jgi:hypothetical protein
VEDMNERTKELTSNICRVIDEQKNLLNGTNLSDLSAEQKDVYFQLKERFNQLSTELNGLGVTSEPDKQIVHQAPLILNHSKIATRH